MVLTTIKTNTVMLRFLKRKEIPQRADNPPSRVDKLALELDTLKSRVFNLESENRSLRGKIEILEMKAEFQDKHTESLYNILRGHQTSLEGISNINENLVKLIKTIKD